MLLIIKFIAKIFSLLNSEVSSREIAAGCAFGVFLGFVPAGGLTLLLMLVALIINFNLAAVFLAAAILKLISYATDPLANAIGYQLLVQVPSLKPFWTTLYNLPAVPYTKFNNTLVLGSFVISLLLVIPAYFLAKAGVNIYRARLQARFQKFKIVQIIKASSFFKYYESFRGVSGS